MNIAIYELLLMKIASFLLVLLTVHRRSAPRPVIQQSQNIVSMVEILMVCVIVECSVASLEHVLLCWYCDIYRVNNEYSCTCWCSVLLREISLVTGWMINCAQGDSQRYVHLWFATSVDYFHPRRRADISVVTTVVCSHGCPRPCGVLRWCCCCHVVLVGCPLGASLQLATVIPTDCGVHELLGFFSELWYAGFCELMIAGIFGIIMGIIYVCATADSYETIERKSYNFSLSS